MGSKTVRMGALLPLASSLALLPLVGGCGSDAPPTVPVVMGSVTSGVSAAGTLRYITEAKIGFPQGGRVAAINVKVGDKVALGQPVAILDNHDQRFALQKAQDQVRIEQLKLSQASASNKAESAATELRNNEKQVTDATRALNETNNKNQATVDRVRKLLDFDRSELHRFQARQRADSICLQEDSDLITPGVQPSRECLDRLRNDLDAVKSAKSAVIVDKTDLVNARNTLESDRADKQVVVDEKKRDRDNSRNLAAFEGTDKPFVVEEQRLTEDGAQADLAIAQKAFQDTIKPSSYTGIVDRINGQVGDVLVPASYSVPKPAGPPDKGPVGTDLIVLKDVNAYQMVVPFSETNGSRITPDKTVDVTFDEIPGLTSQARIASIEPPAADARSKTYMVTVVINQNDPRLKDGLHGTATVALDKVDNTLVVPASAVVVNGRTGLVSLQQQDGTRREVSVELGMVGDKTIEILSGVREKDLVVADHNT